MVNQRFSDKSQGMVGSGLSYSFPAGGMIAAQGLKLALAGAQFFIAHVALKRVGMVLALESELKKDDRLPKNKTFDGPLSCAKYLYKTGKGANGLLRGITSHTLFFAAAAGLHYFFFKCGATHLIMPESSDIHFPCLHGSYWCGANRSNTSFQRHNSKEAVNTALSIGRLTMRISLMTARVLLGPLLTAALCWPAEALFNVIQCNYTADIVSHTSNEVTAQADESQSRDSYLYSNVIDAVTTVWSRVGWHGVLCRTGFEAFALKRYVFYIVFVLPGIIATLLSSPNRREKVAQLSTLKEIFTHPSLLNAVRELIYFILTYPLTNIIYRMSLLGSDETDGRRRGVSRYQNSIECAQNVRAREGWKGLYAGFNYHLIVYTLLEASRQLFCWCNERHTMG